MSDDEDASTQTSGTSGGSYGDWVEPDSDPSCVSLLGPHALASPALAWAELAAATGFDALPEARRRGWGTYQLVRLVNHLRRVGAAAAAAAAAALPQGSGEAGAAAPAAAAAAALRAALAPAALQADAALWRDDSLLQPALQDDALLMDVVSQEDLEEGGGAGAPAAGGGAAPAAPAAAAAAALPEGALSAAEAAALRAELARSKELLGLVVSGAYDAPGPGATGGAADPHRGSGGSDNLTYYFDSYASNTGIHRTMLADRPRTEAYRAAIQGARGGALAGARVLDLGCGTGILSLFAADAGARAVVALDASSVAQDAAEIVRLNGKGAVVACVMGRCEEAALHLVQSSGEAQGAGAGAGAGAAAATATAPLVGQGCTVLCGSLVGGGGGGAASAAAPADAPTRVFDAIVSEWMGYALLYESMLASVLIARDRYLKPGGVLLPSSATLTLGAVSDGELWAERVQWWRSVYGYDMAPMARHAWPEPLVEDLPAGSLASAPPHARLARLCMATMAQEDQDLRGVAFELRIEGGTPRAATGAGGGVLVHALAVWFSVDFGEAERYWPAGAAEAGAAGAGAAAAAAAPAPPAAAGEEDVPELEVVAASGSGRDGGAQAVVPETPQVTLCTSPTSPPTHWHHTVLLLREPPCVQPGGALRGTFSMVRDAKNPREYRFTVELEGGAVQRWHLG